MGAKGVSRACDSPQGLDTGGTATAQGLSGKPWGWWGCRQSMKKMRIEGFPVVSPGMEGRPYCLALDQGRK